MSDSYRIWTILSIIYSHALIASCIRLRGAERVLKEKEVQNERLEQFLNSSYNALIKPVSDKGEGFSDQGAVKVILMFKMSFRQ